MTAHVAQKETIMPTMTVEIWSDVVCPWCYIGKRRFERALAQWEHRDEVEVIWRSFELDPHAPPTTSETVDEMLARKKGMPVSRAAAMREQVTAFAAEEGLEYHLDRAQSGNTFDAHRLIHLAAEHGIGGAAKERLLRAYFTEAQAIGDREALVGLGSELGLDATLVRDALEGDAYADAVRADERRAQLLGISGVPFFVIDNTFGVSGAQAPETFGRALRQAWAETHPLRMLDADAGAACEDGECAVVPVDDVETVR
jgi:predicted DsbA family dithiol-disulfide isomerase